MGGRCFCWTCEFSVLSPLIAEHAVGINYLFNIHNFSSLGRDFDLVDAYATLISSMPCYSTGKGYHTCVDNAIWDIVRATVPSATKISAG